MSSAALVLNLMIGTTEAGQAAFLRASRLLFASGERGLAPGRACARYSVFGVRARGRCSAVRDWLPQVLGGRRFWCFDGAVVDFLVTVFNGKRERLRRWWRTLLAGAAAVRLPSLSLDPAFRSLFA